MDDFIVEQDFWIDQKPIANDYPELKPGAIHIHPFQDFHLMNIGY